MNMMTSREQQINTAEDDLLDVIDKDIANTASAMDDPGESDEKSVSDDWAETTSDSGGRTKDIVPVSINTALKKFCKTLK